MAELGISLGLSDREPKRSSLNQQKFDELPKHHPCNPWKYESEMDDLNERLAEPTPLEDMFPCRT